MFADIPTFTISGLTVLWLLREGVPLLVKWQLNKAQQKAIEDARDDKEDKEPMGGVFVTQWKEWARLIIQEELFPIKESIRELKELEMKRRR